jgi:aspartate/methionine/tyrosine aminotransferase
LGLDLQLFETQTDHHLQPTVEDIKKLGKDIKGLLIISPSNPTGSMILPDQFERIVEYCQKNNITLISDEIYHHIVYRDDLPQVCGLQYSKNLIVINSFSKYYSMPGWRLGWMVVPDNIIDSVRAIARAFFISPPAPSQHVALTAMDCQNELQSHVQQYAENREFLLEEMPKAGYNRFTSVDGAFYFYAHVKHLHEDSLEYCKAMIRDLGVVATPGTAFDPLQGQHYVRFSFAGNIGTIRKAVKLLQAWDHVIN